MARLPRIPYIPPSCFYPSIASRARTSLSSFLLLPVKNHLRKNLQPKAASRFFHSTNPTKPDRSAARSKRTKRITEQRLEANGIAASETTENIPPILQEVEASLNEVKYLQDQTKNWIAIQETVKTFQAGGTESCFTRHFVNDFRPDLIRTTAMKEGRMVDDDRQWTAVQLPKSSGQPSLPVPHSDSLHGFSGSSLNCFPLAADALGSYMFPLGRRGSLGLALPFEAVEIKARTGHLREAELQNLRTSRFMLSNWDRLIAMSEKADGKRARERVQNIAILTVSMWPFGASLHGHWMKLGEDRSMSILHRCLKRWTFPDDVEDASKCMVAASKRVGDHARREVYSDLANIERRLSQRSEPDRNIFGD